MVNRSTISSLRSKQTRLPSSFGLYVTDRILGRSSIDHNAQDRELDKVNSFYEVKEAEV